CKHLLQAHVMRTGNRRDIRSRRHRLFQYPSLRFARPATARDQGWHQGGPAPPRRLQTFRVWTWVQTANKPPARIITTAPLPSSTRETRGQLGAYVQCPAAGGMFERSLVLEPCGCGGKVGGLAQRL